MNYRTLAALGMLNCVVSMNAFGATPALGVYSPDEERVADSVLNKKLSTVLQRGGTTKELMVMHKARIPYDIGQFRNADITRLKLDTVRFRIPWQILHLSALANKTLPFAQGIGASRINVVMTDSDSVNARTFGRTGSSDVTIEFFDGLTYHPNITRDGLSFIYCHELGHQVGGYPFYTKTGWEDYRLSSEGNSDYFAANRCMEFLLRDETVANQQAADTAEPEIAQVCTPNRLRIPLPIDRGTVIDRGGVVVRPIPVPVAKPNGICVRTVRAALNTFKDILGYTVVANTPSASTVATTLYNNYPAAQCRVDTAVKGSHCTYRPAAYYSRPGTSPRDTDVVNEQAIGDQETCWTGYGLNDFYSSPRPTCWFKQALDR